MFWVFSQISIAALISVFGPALVYSWKSLTTSLLLRWDLCPRVICNLMSWVELYGVQFELNFSYVRSFITWFHVSVRFAKFFFLALSVEISDPALRCQSSVLNYLKPLFRSSAYLWDLSSSLSFSVEITNSALKSLAQHWDLLPNIKISDPVSKFGPALWYLA
jgi:hypothetical protein